VAITSCRVTSRDEQRTRAAVDSGGPGCNTGEISERWMLGAYCNGWEQLEDWNHSRVRKLYPLRA